jgi:hypothetical protein
VGDKEGFPVVFQEIKKLSYSKKQLNGRAHNSFITTTRVSRVGSPGRSHAYAKHPHTMHVKLIELMHTLYLRGFNPSGLLTFTWIIRIALVLIAQVTLH